MPSVQEMQRVDRELSLELIESPINPAFLHMSTPLKGYDPMFYLQINGEALWQWRVIKGQNQMFEVLQANLVTLGYRLSSSCKDRVGLPVYGRVNYLTKKVQILTSNLSRRKLRSNFCCTIALHPDEIHQAPADIIASLKETEEELIRENQNLKKEHEGKDKKNVLQQRLTFRGHKIKELKTHLAISQPMHYR